MSENKNNVDRSFGVPTDTHVGTNSKKTKTPNVIPSADSSPALDIAYNSFQIFVKFYAFQTINVIDQCMLSTWLLKYDKAMDKPLRHEFIKLMLLVSHLNPIGHNKLFKHSELNGVIEDQVIQDTDGDGGSDGCRKALSTLDQGKAVGSSQAFAQKSFQLMTTVPVVLEKRPVGKKFRDLISKWIPMRAKYTFQCGHDKSQLEDGWSVGSMNGIRTDKGTCHRQKTPLEMDEQAVNVQANETFPSRRIRIALDPRLIAKAVIVHMDPTDDGLRSRENTENLDADDCARKRPDSHDTGPRSDGSHETEAREPRDDGGDKDAAAENADTRSTKRDCPGGKCSPRAVAASPRVGGEPRGRPVDHQPLAVGGGEDDDGGPARTSGAQVLLPALKSPTKLWQGSSSRIRAGSDLTSSEYEYTSRSSTDIRNNYARLIQLRHMRGRNLGGTAARPIGGPAGATTYVRTPAVPSDCKPREPPVRADKPVQLYERSRLPVPIRPGPSSPRTPRPVRLLYRDWEPVALYLPSTDRSSNRTCSFTLTGTIRLNDLPATTDSCTSLQPQQVSQVQSSLNIHDTDANNLDSSIGFRPPSMDDRSPGFKRDGDGCPDLSAGSSGPMSLSEEALDLTITRPRSRPKSAENRDCEDH